ncbi:MAG: hypothetical protein KDK60_00335 [Chlamydiia bacterium]|nr:hypothetical protein [Chlamydiia bacterium]
MRWSQCLILCALFFCGCEKYYLSVKRERVSRERLASTFVGSPDPRQENPPKGQELILEWWLPKSAFQEHPDLVLKVIYKNHMQETVTYPLKRRRGVETFSLLGDKYRETGGLLTYKAEIIGQNGAVIKEWKQLLWTDLIVIDDSSGK